jgi:arsenate reductase
MFTIYHNPRCGKSRDALKLLRENSIEPEIVEYLKTPLPEEAIQELCEIINIEPIEMTRTKEKFWKEENIDPKNLSSKELIKKLAQFPKGIERAIVIKTDVSGKKSAVVARPPEKILEIL